ncbi:MAG: selenide, water dikinase SelD [Oscillibacter sp.]
MAELEEKLMQRSSCAGCGAKMGAGALASLLQDLPVHQDANLLVGFDKSDDASVYKISDELALVQTVDFFPPIVDDPYLFGQIAAANALSDVYAMGGEPKLAMNLLCAPKSLSPEAVRQILKGGYDKVYEAGAILTGGHSIFDDVPKYGLSVTGFVHPDKVLTNSAARPGDVLLLTKPLGIGVLTTAAKAGLLSPEGLALANSLMTTLNKSARDAMVRFRVHACTDVTGFSLLGHALEMARGSGVELELYGNQIDCIPEAVSLANMGILPEGMYRNRSFAEEDVDAGTMELCKQDVLYDPQTSGGLLMAVDPRDADALFAALQGTVPSAQRIGLVRDYQGGKRIFLR